MKVKEIMTKKPDCATPDMELNKVAKIMADRQVGSIPVVENKNSLKVVGVVTDRDIVMQVVAKSKDPLSMTAKDIMSSPVVTVNQDADIQDAALIMGKNKIRRVPVVDENDHLIGILAQADIALKSSDQMTAKVVGSVSKPGKTATKGSS